MLGEDYVSILREGYERKWCDVYPKEGKVEGAYSVGGYDTAPYMFLNFEGRYFDVSTLAHESGHSMHDYYAHHNNLYQYSRYSQFVSEVSSTVNELLLVIHLVNNSNDNKDKLFFLKQLMYLFVDTIYRLTQCAEFEKEIYEDAENGIPLTSEHLNNTYARLSKKYYGENVIVDDSEKYQWASMELLYYNFFYYKYPISLSIACHIVSNILSGKENAVSDYKKFLCSGSTLSPLDSLKLAGVDLSSKEVVESALKMFESAINEFKRIYEQTNIHNDNSAKALVKKPNQQ